MQTLCHFTLLTRLVLAWFVLSLGVAVASPLVNPQDTLLVCTGAGAMKVLVKADDGGTREVTPLAMDCPLCVSASAPPPAVQVQADTTQSFGVCAPERSQRPHCGAHGRTPAAPRPAHSVVRLFAALGGTGSAAHALPHVPATTVFGFRALSD